jgi:hypothetical protein
MTEMDHKGYNPVRHGEESLSIDELELVKLSYF